MHFGTAEALGNARAEIAAVGAVLAVCDHNPMGQPIAVRVVVGSKEAPTRVRCSVHAMQPGSVVVQALEKGAWLPVFAELLSEPASSSQGGLGSPSGVLPSAASMTTPTPPVSMGAPTATASATGTVPAPSTRAFSMPRSGRLRRPRTVAEVCSLPVHRGVTENDLQHPTVPLLLRWLRTSRGILRVEFKRGDKHIAHIVTVDGRDTRASLAAAALARQLVEDDVQYVVEELTRPPTLSHNMRTLHLNVEVIRVLLAQFTPDEIAAVVPFARDNRLVRAVAAVADALGFDGTHARLIKTSLAGSDSVAAVVRNPIGPRTAWDVLVVLSLFDGLAFSEQRAEDPETSRGKVAKAQVDSATEAMLTKDFFAVLGLHWSSAPSEVDPAYRQVKQAWSTLKRPADPALADKVLARIDEAFRTLRDDARRQAYRRSTFNMVWPHQAQLLVAQAKLAHYRKDFPETLRLLHAAEDLSPSAEAAHLLKLALSKSAPPKT